MIKNHSSKTDSLNKSSDLPSALDALKKNFFHLEEHTRRNKNTSHINYKIYYLLCNPYTFVNAYAKISKNKGALTKGVDKHEQTMFFFGRSNAEQIAKKFKTNTYEWKPVRRTWIQKPGKPFPKFKRPIDAPTQEDKIVQEALRGILEAIFEPEFEEFEKSTKFLSTNFGFRPKKSTWDSVKNLKYSTQRCNICIEGDIKGAYNSINQELLLDRLNTRIKDKKFLKLIKNLLLSGVMDQGQFFHSLTGTPQGSIVSPLLFNIYMFNFDKYIYHNIVEPMIKNPPKPKQNPEYKRILFQESKLLKKLDKQMDKTILKKYKSLRRERQNISTYVITSIPKSAVFIRYADDWVLFLNCTHKKAQQYKNQITEYIKKALSLELDGEKTLITSLENGVSFLGFTIIKWSKSQRKKKFVLQRRRNKIVRSLRQTTSNKINILPDKSRIRRNLILKGFCNSDLYPIGRRGLAELDEFEIVLKYRQIMLGIIEYYRNCDSTRALNQLSYILQYSCAKTLATRQKTTIRKIFDKYTTKLIINRQFFTQGETINKRTSFPTYPELKKLGKLTPRDKGNYEGYESKDPFYIQTFWRTKLQLYYDCCICGSTEKVGLHHINSLRKIKKNKDRFGYIRSKINRIQIPVCHKCHVDITKGVYTLYWTKPN